MIKRARDLKERVSPSNLVGVDNPSRSQIPMQYLYSNSDQKITYEVQGCTVEKGIREVWKAG